MAIDWNRKLAAAWFNPKVLDFNDLRNEVFGTDRTKAPVQDDGAPTDRRNGALQNRVETFVIGSCLFQTYPPNYITKSKRGTPCTPKMPKLVKSHTTPIGKDDKGKKTGGVKKWKLLKALASTRTAVSEDEFLEGLGYDLDLKKLK